MGELHIAMAFARWLRRWRNPEAEIAPDGCARILRHSRAFLAVVWFLTAFAAAGLGFSVAMVITPPPWRSRFDSNLVCLGYALVLPFVVYYVTAAHRLTVRFDEEGFTLDRFLREPLRVAWGDVRRVTVGQFEKYLAIYTDGGCAQIHLQVNGLGRFALYLEHFSPVELSYEVRAFLPRLETPPDQTPAPDGGRDSDPVGTSGPLDPSF